MRLEFEDILGELSARLEKEKSLKRKVILKDAINLIKKL